MGITRIQYPFSAPNFEETYIVIMVELEDGQRKSDAEFDTAADYFKAQCNLCRYNFSHDTKAQQLVEFTKNFIRETRATITDFKLIKIPTAYFSSANELATYMINEFNKTFLIPGHGLQCPCKLSVSHDPITQKLTFNKDNINIFRVATLTKNLHSNLGTSLNCWADKLFWSEPHWHNAKKASLKKLGTMYIYCDAVKYQIVGDTQAPLIAMLQVEESPNKECHWIFNPVHYLPVNKRSIPSIELRICTESGDPFPFEPNGNVVAQLHVRKQRFTW